MRGVIIHRILRYYQLLSINLIIKNKNFKDKHK